jgi:diacylglycerol kinase (ATP)
MADSGAGAQRAAVVYNPVKVNLDDLKAAVARAEQDAGWGESMWFETTEEDPGGGQTTKAIEQGADVVMAAGGDGTVRAVAESLRGSGVPIGLLPSGTGNLLARNLNLTLSDIPDSIVTALSGKDRKIDLGVVEIEHPDGTKIKKVFLVMAGLGLDAQMIVNTDDELKKRVGWLAYVDAIRKALRDSNRLRIRYRLDGGPQKVLSAHTVLIGNCGSLPANILLLPEAAVDDGIFDIIALRPEGFFGWVQVWIKIVWENGVLRRTQAGRKLMGEHKPVRTLRYLKGSELILRLERPEEFQLDGDAFGEVVAIKAVVDPGALTVRIPQDAEIG